MELEYVVDTNIATFILDGEGAGHTDAGQAGTHLCVSRRPGEPQTSSNFLSTTAKVHCGLPVVQGVQAHNSAAHYRTD